LGRYTVVVYNGFLPLHGYVRIGSVFGSYFVPYVCTVFGFLLIMIMKRRRFIAVFVMYWAGILLYIMGFSPCTDI
jgi:uncharacterized membrane protein